MVHYATLSKANKVPLYRKFTFGGTKGAWFGSKNAQILFLFWCVDTLRKQTDNVILKKELIEMMKQSGSLEYTRQRMVDFNLEIKKEISQWPENVPFTEYLNKMLVELNLVIV